MTPEEDEAEYQRLLKKWDEWKARGVRTPIASSGGQDLEPLWDEALPLGSSVLIPALSQGWDWCTFEKDEQGFYAKGKYGSYRLAYGPNWYVTTDLDTFNLWLDKHTLDDTDLNDPPETGTR